MQNKANSMRQEMDYIYVTELLAPLSCVVLQNSFTVIASFTATATCSNRFCLKHVSIRGIAPDKRLRCAVIVMPLHRVLIARNTDGSEAWEF